MAKKKKSKKFLAELLFWLHTAALLIVVISGLIVSWVWVLIILVLVRAQQVLFHGCIITIWEVKAGGMRRGTVYFQVAAKRFLGLRLSHTGVHIASSLQVLLTIAVVAAANIWHIRLHL